MKLVCLADTHNTVIPEGYTIPDGDVFIHVGDFCNTGDFRELIINSVWFNSLPHNHKIVVAGNHDKCLESDKSCRNFLYNVIYLEDESFTLNGVKFYGTPYQPPFNNWAFNLTEEELDKKFAKIPDDTNVLLTHCPPKNILDTVKGQSLGSTSLRKHLDRLTKLKVHIFGHLHDSYGTYYDTATGVTYINCSVLDEDYTLANKPIVIEI